MTDVAWDLVDEVRAYHGFLTVLRRTYRLPDGRLTTWDVTAPSRSEAVLARTEAGLFVLARQFRPGPGVVLDELPGGGVEDGEPVAAAAARELWEETGYRAGSMRVVGRTWHSAASGMEKFCAVATDCVFTGASSPDPEELIATRLVSLSELLAILRHGDLTDAGQAYRALDDLGLL